MPVLARDACPYVSITASVLQPCPAALSAQWGEPIFAASSEREKIVMDRGVHRLYQNAEPALLKVSSTGSWPADVIREVRQPEEEGRDVFDVRAG